MLALLAHLKKLKNSPFCFVLRYPYGSDWKYYTYALYSLSSCSSCSSKLYDVYTGFEIRPNIHKKIFKFHIIIKWKYLYLLPHFINNSHIQPDISVIFETLGSTLYTQIIMPSTSSNLVFTWVVHTFLKNK